MGPATTAIVSSLVSAVAGSIVQGAMSENSMPISFAVQNAIDKGLNSLYQRHQWNTKGKFQQNMNQLSQAKRDSQFIQSNFNAF